MTADRFAEDLKHMRQAAVDALAFVEGSIRDTFLADKRTQQAVVMSLIILGEAATKIIASHPEIAAANPAVPWRAMRGMRNRMAHGYYEVDLDVVWETVQTALPGLLKQLPHDCE